MNTDGPDHISAYLVQLNDALKQMRLKQEFVDESTLAWQRRIEGKVDQQLHVLGNGFTQRSCRPSRSLPIHPRASIAWNPQTGQLPTSPGEEPSQLPVEEPSNCQPPEKRDDGAEHAWALGFCSNSGSPAMKASQAPLARAMNKRRESKHSLFGQAQVKTKKVDNFIIQARREEILSATTWLLHVTESKKYEMGVMFVIFLNSMLMGWQVQVVAHRVEHSFKSGTAYNAATPDYFLVLESCFAFFFFVELMLRWYAEGFRAFIFSSDAAWNCFDIVTVFTGVVELVLELSGPNHAIVASISVIRVLRILRIVRLLKVIRSYVWFHELRLMFESCLNSFKSYMWTILVLLLLIYLFAIFLTTGTCSFLSDGNKYSAYDGTQIQLLQAYFGTVDKSMLSLFQTITGGQDWSVFYDALSLLGSVRKLVYLVYISFAIFAVCNVVAAVFVESAMQSASKDRETLIRDTLMDAQEYQSKMLSVFHEMDKDGTGTLSEEEFLEHLDDERVVAYFNSMKLDVSDATSLFKLLDVDHSGTVEAAEFIEGCQKLKGTSRTLDMHLMRYELHSLRFELHDLALKFYKYAEMKGVEHLGDQALAKNEHLESPIDMIEVRRAITEKKMKEIASLRKAGSTLPAVDPTDLVVQDVASGF